MADEAAANHAGPAVEVHQVSKRYGATQALDDVSLTVQRGTSHALVGRNGAGKSTLVGVLTGLIRPDSGTVRVSGRAVETEPGNAQLACVYQRPQTLPHLTVAENLALGVDQSQLISWRRRRRHAAQILTEWQVPVRPDELARHLNVEQRQLLEIARALSRGSEVVVLDEPTAQLDRRASQRLFDHLRAIRDRGITFIFISHHLEEVFETCHTATILRDGRVAGTYPTADLSPGRLVDLMVGGPGPAAPAHPAQADPSTRPPEGRGREPRLQTANLTWPGHLDNINLQIRPGEILGLGGLAGSGKVAVAESIVGLHPRTGTVTVGGQPLRSLDVAAGQRAGLGFVPEDRHKEGFVGGLSVTENLTMTVLPTLSRHGWLDRRRRTGMVKRVIAELAVVPADPERPVHNLSGGNQQKVVMGRALASAPTVLVLIAPTAGVDVASKASLYHQIRRSADAGTAVLIVSDEIDELALADRVCVMFSGRMFAEFTNPPDRRDLIAAIEGVHAAAPTTSASGGTA